MAARSPVRMRVKLAAMFGIPVILRNRKTAPRGFFPGVSGWVGLMISSKKQGKRGSFASLRMTGVFYFGMEVFWFFFSKKNCFLIPAFGSGRRIFRRP
ncbi:MAG: hypothetical protein IT555_21335 [Acetobacteraceae bacterium]|nr:hypothetical protein [Acetobacteraceae bacterium]